MTSGAMMAKKDNRVIADPHAIFLQGWRFHCAADLLERNLFNGSSAERMGTAGAEGRLTSFEGSASWPVYGFPNIVNATLSVELLLKALVTIQLGYFEKGHGLSDFFAELNADSQRRIAELYAVFVSRNPIHIRPTISDAASAQVALVDALQQHNKAFEVARYAFERPKGEFTNLRAVRSALLAYFAEFRSDWFQEALHHYLPLPVELGSITSHDLRTCAPEATRFCGSSSRS